MKVKNKINSKIAILALVVVLMAVLLGVNVFVQAASQPASGAAIDVKIDTGDNELFYFRFGGGYSCAINVVEEDDNTPDDKGTEHGAGGKIIKHTSGSLADGTNGCSMDSDQCDVLHHSFRSSISRKCGDCSLGQSSGYWPKGDILCGFDGIWYMCDSGFHNKFFKSGTKGYKCTTGNEWIPTEICGNGNDDEGDGKIDCADDECYGLTKDKISIEDPASIGEHNKDFTDTKIYYHPTCNPDLDKTSTPKSETVCKAVGAPEISITKKAYDYYPTTFTSTPQNQCCGDDRTDCAKVEDASVASKLLCAVDNTQGSAIFSQWLKSDGAADSTGAGLGNIKFVKCSSAEHVSNGAEWVKCENKKFVGTDKEIIKIPGASGHEYLCQGTGLGSVVECCGNDLANCQSKDTSSGKRLKTGESVNPANYKGGTIDPAKCGNNALDANEQCDGAAGACPTGQTCNSCSCSGQTGCPTGQLSCSGACKEPECSSTKPCTQTDYTCQSPGTCEAQCKAPNICGDGDCNHAAQEYCGGANYCEQDCGVCSGGENPPPEIPFAQVVASDFITGNVISITGYAVDAPDESATVQSLAAGRRFFTDAERRGFRDEVVTALSAKDPNWGYKSTLTGPISDDTIGYATPEMRASNRLVAIDLIGGDSGQAQWLNHGEVSGRWYSATGGGGAGTGATGASSSSGTYYCKSDGTFQKGTIGPTPTNPTPTNPTVDKDACIKAGFDWTGSKCCGEPDDKPEYYNDPTTNVGTSATGNLIKEVTGNAASDCGGGPYFNKLGGFDFAKFNDCSVQSPKYKAARVFSNFETPQLTNEVISQLNEAGLSATKISNDVVEFNVQYEGQLVGKVDVIQSVYANGIGIAWIWLPVSSGSGEGSSVGGCWDSNAVISIGFVDGSKNSIVNYKGQFYGCAIDKTNYNKENDNTLSLKDAFTKGQLIKNENYCSLLPDKSYYCSYTEKWEQTDGKDKSKLSTSPLENPAQKSECCAAMECWDGTKCIENQKDDPLAPLLGDGYKCIDGNWKKLSKKCTPDENACGYCGEESQCLLSPLSQDIASRCINSGEYSGDDYCDNGQWSTRTKLLALKLLGMKTADYVLLCDDKQNTLNNLRYVVDSGDAAETVIANLQANNFCVLKNKDKTIMATSVNKNLEEVRGGFSILGIKSCSNAKNDGNYYSCDNTNRVWYNKKLKSIIYSQSSITVTPSQEPSSSLSGIIMAIIDAIKRLIIPPPFDESYIQSIKRFDKIFLAQQGTKSIRGAIEGKTFKNAVIEYNRFDQIDICSYVNTFNQAGSFTLSGMSCKKEGNNYYVLAQGGELTSFNPENVWPDLTAKLRLK